MHFKRSSCLHAGAGMLLVLIAAASCQSPDFGSRESGTHGKSRAKGKEPQFWVNQQLINTTSPSRTRVVISLTHQSAAVYDDDGNLILKTDVSTGVRQHPTPVGEFRILEKIIRKRSNIFGTYVDAASGETSVPFMDNRTVSQPPGTTFLGTPMPYWMRLTWDGVGMHVGKFRKGNLTSHGCIRIPARVQPIIYRICQKGTPVSVVP